ncbi:hypothetical protein [Hyalangium versicolor]|uniref:hypothetical protein n=1 Tax=Hyalangium versicolor TaxID=2861190 RepID=UPI001CC93554|nr:hypothetical protein [Hyalangium versicolor]
MAGFLAMGCGGSTSTPDDGNTDSDPESGPLMPWKAGNRWSFRVTEDGQTSTKETTVGELEPVGGTGPYKDLLVNKVVTMKGAGDKTLSWQAVSEKRLVRYREQSFRASTGELELDETWDPPKLHVDESAAHTTEGASWLEDYKETKQPDAGAATTETNHDRWTVVADDESVTVPAGTFRATVLRKTGGSTTKTYWFVRGIGKVKESGGQLEELTSYEVAP